MFSKSYDLYSLFWGLNMKMIDVDKIKKIDDNAMNRHDEEKKGFLGKMGDLVRKTINCCLE